MFVRVIIYKPLIKILRAYGGLLGIHVDEGRGYATICFGELLASFDPEISEWGNPHRVMSMHPCLNS